MFLSFNVFLPGLASNRHLPDQFMAAEAVLGHFK
jgi:hypothetical protein